MVTHRLDVSQAAIPTNLGKLSVSAVTSLLCCNRGHTALLRTKIVMHANCQW